MKILHFTTDLMLGSQLSQAARGRGMTVEMINRLDRLFERADAATALVAIDLQCTHWSSEEFRRLRDAHSIPLRAIAYAQHVFPELLADARFAGIENVMTRGQFAASIEQVLDNAIPREA